MPVSLAWGNSAYKCSMGNYDFQGTHYSDQYNVPATQGQQACTDRARFNSEDIKTKYKENHKKIRDQIAKMKSDPECSYLTTLMDEYLMQYQKHEDNHLELTAKRSEFLTEKIEEYDIQKGYAYAGAFNGTCSGGHNRKTSFLNLEFVNKLPQVEGSSSKVARDGEKIDSCSDVTAAGSDDLKSFTVSTKKAKGNELLFTWDPFSIPDHVTVKTLSGKLLYDSGCKGSESEPVPLKLELPKDGIVVNIINTCEDPKNKGSSWSLRIQCAESVPEVCKAPREELINLVKNEIEQTKTLIDANKLQQQCYFYIDKNILGKLLEDGLISEETSPMTNGICDKFDEACVANAKEKMTTNQSQRSVASSSPGEVDPGFQSEFQSEYFCPERKDVEDSLFKTVSYAYCNTGWKRVGYPFLLAE